MDADKNQVGLALAVVEARRRCPEEVLNFIPFALFFGLPHDTSLLILITDCQSRHFSQSFVLQNRGQCMP